MRPGGGLPARYAEHVRGYVDKGALRPLKVVADAGNGMAGHVVPPVFEGPPFDLVPMYFELDGTFHNHFRHLIALAPRTTVSHARGRSPVGSTTYSARRVARSW